MAMRAFKLICVAAVFLAGQCPIAAGQERERGMSDWYEFRATSTPQPGAIGMQTWLHTPAGKFGRIKMDGSRLVLSDNGEDIRLWGLNVCYSACSPEKPLAEKRAAFYAKYGINAVRLHKYADGTGWAGIQSAESFAELDPQALDRMDYFIAQLKKHGIYVKLSPTFGVKLGPADRGRVPYIDEFGKVKPGDRVNTGHGSIYIGRELQDLLIEQVTSLLKHRNPYTGLTYAEDPAIAVVELFNEDSALFYGTMERLQKIPALRKRATEMFSDWLRGRYGTHDKLVEAWGADAIDSFATEKLTGENLDQRTVIPAGNPWFYDPTQLAGSQKPKAKRMYDTMLFWYEVQCAFYDRYVAALRQASYEGAVLGSNWQAGRAFSHYYNLYSDYRVGIVDRHNYFGGRNATMLDAAGSGLLGTGMQQVADRPFMLSEWIHVWPSEYGVEGPAILGAYGMGLQGWDVSFMFQNRDNGGFSEKMGRDTWDVTAPQVLGIFPAVARQVLRRDVKESDLIVPRNVHIPSLHEGKLGFEDSVGQEDDVKTFDSGAVPARTLAVAKAVVRFTDEFEPTPAFDLAPYVQGGALVSSTAQLRWTQSSEPRGGFFTIDTPATKAIVGFVQGRSVELGDVAIASQSPFAAIYVTALEPDKDIASSSRLLITAIARARNTGQRVDGRTGKVISPGEPPILMEPVKATITVRRKGSPTVTLLDHDGLLTQRKLQVKDGALTIDGTADKTMYYLISFE
jgi:hypothetical protein